MKNTFSLDSSFKSDKYGSFTSRIMIFKIKNDVFNLKNKRL